MSTETKNLPAVYVEQGLMLPDNDQWEHRFEVRSETSNRIYVIAQHKTKRHWGCSCPGWKAHRTCKHLSSLGMPAKEKPHEMNIIEL